MGIGGDPLVQLTRTDDLDRGARGKNPWLQIEVGRHGVLMRYTDAETLSLLDLILLNLVSNHHRPLPLWSRIVQLCELMYYPKNHCVRGCSRLG